MKLEICVDSVESAVVAQRAGADRVELCASLIEGGITPSPGTMKVARRKLSLGLMLMIRPRGGDFLYDDVETEAMLEDVHAAKSLGADGVVFGCLRADGSIDGDKTRTLLAAAKPLAVTFHRAFDVCRDPFEALEQLVELGVTRLLTSGQQSSVLEGIELIATLRERARGRIIVMPGGGITPSNVRKVVELSGADEIHMAWTKTQESGMSHRNARVYMGGALYPPEYSREVAEEDGIRSVRQLLR
jgi:copper homeostasis protein